jgi:hypothetical protein
MRSLLLVLLLPLLQEAGGLEENDRGHSRIPAVGNALREVQLDYQPSWSNEFFRLHDIRGDIWVFGAFWDVRHRQYNLRNGYWTKVKFPTPSPTHTPNLSVINNGSIQTEEPQSRLHRRLGTTKINPLYVRIYMVGRKGFFRIGDFAGTSTDYRTGHCELHYESGLVQQVPYYVQSQSREINKRKNQLIGAYAICNLPENQNNKDYPVAVALVPLNFKGAKHVMIIRGNRQAIRKMAIGNRKADKRRGLAVCVRPIFGIPTQEFTCSAKQILRVFLQQLLFV